MYTTLPPSGNCANRRTTYSQDGDIFAFCLCSLAQVYPFIQQTCLGALLCPRCYTKSKSAGQKLQFLVGGPGFWGLRPDGLKMKLSHCVAYTPLGLFCPSLDIDSQGPSSRRSQTCTCLSVLSVNCGISVPSAPVTVRVGKGPFPRSQARPFLMSMNSLGKGLVNSKMDEK